MKRFIAKVLIFLIIIVTISSCINFVYLKRDNSDLDCIKKFQDIPASVMVCNFGSSHGLYGFNYEDIEEVDCFNFALTSQTLSYDRRVFDCYKDSISEGAVVFIPVSYFSLFGNDEETEDDFLNKNKRYYKILPSDMIKNYDIKTDIYVRYFPSLSATPYALIKTLLAGGRDTNDETWSRMATGVDVQHDAELAGRRHIIKNKTDKNGNRIVNQEELESLEYIINGCYEKGCIPILVTTPFLSEYTNEIKKMDSDFYDDFYSLIDQVVTDTGVSYCDYGFDDRFTENYGWFMNSDHLNKEGARQFVNILMDEVVHYGSDESLIK